MRLDQLPKIVRDRLNALARFDAMPPDMAALLRAEAKALSDVFDECVTAALLGARKLMKPRPSDDHCKQLEHFTRRILDELPAKRDWLDPDLERIGRDALKVIDEAERPVGKTLMQLLEEGKL